MKKGLLVAMVSCVLFLFSTPVFAAGGYVGLEGGAVWLSSSSVDVAGINVGDIKFDTGWGIGGVGGYDFGMVRVELELAYRSNDAKEFNDATGGGTSPLSGEVTSTALMVNAYYDFRGLSPHVIPYLGAGIGGANVSADLKDDVGQVVDDDEIVFAYQFVAGVAFPVTKELAIDLNYRYFATANPSLEITGTGVKADVEYGTSNVFLGLRYSF